MAEQFAAMEENGILETLHSGYRQHHSSETALLKVTNDLLVTYDAGTCSIRVLIDLGAAPDAIDDGILFRQTEEMRGHNWYTSKRF